MTHADAFLRDILAHPDDDAPRLILADWLDEQGDAHSIARAEFIRVQCALAAASVPQEQRARLLRREEQILEAWDKEWVRPIRRLLQSWEYQRGFVSEVAMRGDTFLSYADRLFQLAPIQTVTLGPERSSESGPSLNVAVLAESRYLRRLRGLGLSQNRLESRHVRALVVSEHLTNLTELDLSDNRIGDGGIRSLAGSPLLGRLEYLNLRGNDIGANGVRALTQALEELAHSSEGLRLQRLELSHDNLRASGQRVIAASPVLRRVVRL